MAGGLSTRRRLSAADQSFLRLCLGEESDSDDFFSVEGSEGFASLPETPQSNMHGKTQGEREEDQEHVCDHVTPGCVSYNLFSDDESSNGRAADSDAESDGSQGLENMFSFSCMEKVAEALRRGADVQELSLLVEEAMADALEIRLATVSEAEDCENDDSDSSGTITPSMSLDVTGLMTPPQCTTALSPRAVVDSPGSPGSGFSSSPLRPRTTGELDGRMTPPEGAGGAKAAIMLSAAGAGAGSPHTDQERKWAERLQEALAAAGPSSPPRRAVSMMRRRASAAARVEGDAKEDQDAFTTSSAKARRASIAHNGRLAQAVKAATTSFRRSLAPLARDASATKLHRTLSSGGAAGEAEEAAEAAQAGEAARMRKSVAGACRRHRQSILLAAEVLEAAGVVGTEAASREEAAASQGDVDTQLNLVHKAVESARRRHRMSIAQAVEKAVEKTTATDHEREPGICALSVAKPVTTGAEAGATTSVPLLKLQEVPPCSASCHAPCSGCEGGTSARKAVARERVDAIVAAAYQRHEDLRKTHTKGKKVPVLGVPRALMQTRVGLPGMRPHVVHCGPARPSPPDPRYGGRTPRVR